MSHRRVKRRPTYDVRRTTLHVESGKGYFLELYTNVTALLSYRRLCF
jgi:hypothetical protein